MEQDKREESYLFHTYYTPLYTFSSCLLYFLLAKGFCIVIV